MINVENSKIQNPLPFRVFCQKVIPLAFDESMSYLELLYALLHYLKETYIQKINDSILSIRVPGCITVGNIYLDSNIITAIELDISTGIYSSKCLDYIKQIIGDEIVLI